MDLGQYQEDFMPRKAIKAQALADFIAEWTDTGTQGDEGLGDYWTMYFDGSYTLKGAGTGVIFISPTGETIKYAIELEFKATNNIAEYEGLVTGLRIAKTRHLKTPD